jgi:drug/metabolite transporter (DMT)-like permease
VIWGGNIPAIKYLLRTLEPTDVLLLRIGGAAIIFAAILASRRGDALPKSRRDAISLFLLGALGITVMNFALINGQNMISAALASLIVTSNPVFTAIISRFFTGEALTSRKIGGIALATLGFLIVLLLGSGKDAELSADHVKGMLIVMIAPFSWAFYTVLSKPYLQRYPSTNVAAYTAIAGAIGALPLLAREDGATGRLGEIDAVGWLAVLFLSALGFVLAYVLWYRGLNVLTPSQTAVYIYLVPVFGLVFAWWLLDEEITPYLLLGGATILAGVILTNSGRRAQLIDPAAIPPAAPAD